MVYYRKKLPLGKKREVICVMVLKPKLRAACLSFVI